MTVAAGFRFSEGVLLCADTQITYQGIAKVSGTKIFPYEFQSNGAKVIFTFSGNVSYAKGGIKECVRAIARLHAPAREELENAVCDSLNSYFQKLIYKHPHYQLMGGPDFNLVIGLWSPKDGLGLYETTDAVVTEVNDSDKFTVTGVGGTLGRYLATQMMGHSGYSLADMSTISIHVLSEVKANVDGCGKGSEFIVLTKEGRFSSVGGSGGSQVEDVFESLYRSFTSMLLELCDLDKSREEGVLRRLDDLRKLALIFRQGMVKEREKHPGLGELVQILMDYKVRKIE